MECVVHRNNEGGYAERGSKVEWPRALKRKFGADCSSGLQLDVTISMPRTNNRKQMCLDVVPSNEPAGHKYNQSDYLSVDLPFMNNMDEISYWIYTKRAPCLMNYDLLKKQQEEAQCSKSKLKNVPSSVEDVPSPKKKKRKHSVLDDSVSTEKQKNVYFDASKNKQVLASSCKSSSIISDLDFNIKHSSIQVKPKKIKPKRSRTVMHKKAKVVTSTPKVTSNLRRSLRKTQTNHNNNSQFNKSLEIMNANIVNGIKLKSTSKSADKSRKSVKIVEEVEMLDNDIANEYCPKEKPNTKNTLNGQFEDLSDVSGFTANYIRSTKLNSTKKSRNLRSKAGRNLMKESQCEDQKDNSMLICVNKSTNTGVNKNLNCSTDSSQNIINLVTTQCSNEHPGALDRTTSLLKFMDTKNKQAMSSNKDSDRLESKINLNDTYQTLNSSTSRYPKRQKNQFAGQTNTRNITNINIEKARKNSNNFNNSNRKENPEDKCLSRTRSGRCIGLALRQPDNSVLVLSNSTEQVSSVVTMNVVSSQENVERRQSVTRHYRGSKSMNKSEGLQRDSLRDKSGFAACFSDSDEGSDVKKRKYFC